MIPALSLQTEIISLKEEPSTEKKKPTSQIYLTEIYSLPVRVEEKPETFFSNTTQDWLLVPFLKWLQNILIHNSCFEVTYN